MRARTGKVVALAACLAVVFGLASCGNSGVSSASDSNAAASSSGWVYAIQKITVYSEDGKIITAREFEYDEGNCVGMKLENADESGELNEVSVSYGDFTPEGYPRRITSSAGEEQVCDYVIEDGRAIEERRNSVLGCSYTYYENGYMKTRTTYGENGKDLQEVVEYDENGYTTRYTRYGERELTGTLKWDFQDGNPTGYTASVPSPTGSQSVKYTVECDNDGNIVRMYYEDGRLYEEISYVVINNPSTYVLVGDHNKPR